MEYAGKTYPRYLVWHPLDHISYEVSNAQPDGSVGKGTRLRITEEFQRKSDNYLQINVQVRQRNEETAIIEKRVAGMVVVELVNKLEPTTNGTNYISTMTIGTTSWPRHLGLNKVLNSKILWGKWGSTGRGITLRKSVTWRTFCQISIAVK
ncbi:hypothetical protein R6258_00280 [Halomonas sp. HP20-15]|uniref:hypothetical protein n=1 Tax=Halomonas sp. HP20-15 TaxID=3085901 RepID=UPI0029812F15|nr:hypothetical protein [Halomonas sp. HP20-15]MDW5375340.1 hypothetical protein [Halomonas sp. HP20-15]